MPDSDQELLILQLSDTHLHATRQSRMRGVNTHDTLKQVLDHVLAQAQWPPDLVLATGDLVQDESRDGYEMFRDLLRPLGVDVACIPGNHDDPALMRYVLSEPPFQVGGTIEMRGWGIILLDTFLFGNDGGELGANALCELANQLGLRDRCLFTGTLPAGVARALVQKAAVLTSPRITGNNTPLKIYELLASDVPLVATRILAHTQVLSEEVCYLAEPDPKDFSRALIIALTDVQGSADKSRAAHELYDQKYSRAQYVEKMKAVLAAIE